MKNITLCMRTWCEVRNFAWHRIKKFWNRAESESEKVTLATSKRPTLLITTRIW